MFAALPRMHIGRHMPPAVEQELGGTEGAVEHDPAKDAAPFSKLVQFSPNACPG